jgi:nitrate/TMAO reductase-like tetraheme cytochrome c subunit
MKSERTRPHTLTATAFPLGLLALALPLLFSAQVTNAADPKEQDSCATCHDDPGFLVTNKKLYDYFQEWSSSVHKQEGVSCQDCHGGNAKTDDKTEAHGDGVAASDKASGIYYKNVPDTCGGCHEEILEGFQKSEHFEHVVAKKQEDQGPTCVTCHGSINVGILDVNSVAVSCERCHSEESENHPENPQKARAILNKFLSMQRFYRYITIRAESDEAKEFFAEIDPRIHDLSVTWHTFDLDRIQEETNNVLSSMKKKRDELRKRSSAQE